MSGDDHASRVTERAVTDIASVISRYRAGDIGFESMVSAIEIRIGSLIGVADPEWIEEWRSHWNRLEYVNATLIDEDRPDLRADERKMVEDTLDALDSMTHR